MNHLFILSAQICSTESDVDTDSVSKAVRDTLAKMLTKKFGLSLGSVMVERDFLGSCIEFADAGTDPSMEFSGSVPPD